MSQNNSSQQFGVGNIQMWQQHLLYKQPQEFQRQHQLQQLDQGSRQQNLKSYSSTMAKPTAANPFPITTNEMPVNGGSNFMWGNSFAGGTLTIANHSQPVNAGNMDWTQSSSSPAMGTVAMHNVANGLTISNEQSQLTRPMSYAPQQTEQSFCGMPVSSSRLYGNQYSQFLGTSGDSTNLMTGRTVNHAEKASETFSSFQCNQNFPSEGPLQDRNAVNQQNFQGKSFYGRATMEMLNGDATSGNFQQVDSNVQMSIPVQNAQNMQKFYSQEEQTVQVETSSSVAILDPTEHKLLFGTDEDDNWGTSFSSSLGIAAGGYRHGSSSLENGSSGGFASIQSGSWSALMQEAVQVSSSEKGLQEEWSGLSLQNMEQSMLKNSSVPENNGRQLAAGGDNHRPSASSSRSLPLFNNAEPSLCSSNATLFQHSFISVGDEDKKIQNEDPNMSFRLSPGEDRNKQFNQVQKHNQPFEGDLQVQTGAPNGTWAAQSHQQQGSILTGLANPHGGWSHQQNMPLSSIPRHSSNFYDPVNIWGNSRNGGNLNSEVQSLELNAGSSEMKNEDPAVGNFGPQISSNAMRLNQQIKEHAEDSQHVVLGTNFSLSSSMNDKDANTVRIENLTSQMRKKLDRSFADNEEGLATQNKNENPNDISGEGCVSKSLTEGHKTNIANAVNDDLSVSNYYAQNIFVHGNQKSGNETGQITIAPNFFQNPFVSMGSHPHLSLPVNHQSNILGFSNSENEEQRHVEESNNTGHVQNVTLLKGVGIDVLERNTNSVNTSGLFTGSAAQPFENGQNAYSSQNMLALLHKVEQSKKFLAGSASDSTGCAVGESESSHTNQSKVMKGYGLKLAPPARWPSHLKYGFPQVINDNNSRQLDKDIGSKDQAGSDCAPSIKSYNHEAYQRANLDCSSDISKQKHKAVQELAVQYDSSQTKFSKVSHVGTRNQVEPQQHQEVNHNSHSFGHPVKQEFNSIGPASASIYAVTDSGIHSVDKKQPIAAISHQNASVQQFPVAGARSVLQPPGSGMPQQPGSPKMLHSVWAKISAQQRLAGIQPHRNTPQLLQSIINSGQGSSLGELPKEFGEGNIGENVSSETGRSPVNSQNEESEIQGESSTTTHYEKVSSASKMCSSSRWQESDHKADLDQASDSSLSSLVHLHRQDVDKSKKSEVPSVSTHQMPAPATANAASCSSHLRVSQHMLTSSSQWQNYSLLHQMQAMKDGDSDPSKLLGKRPRSADLGCSTSQGLNGRQGFIYGQKAPSSVPLDGKDGGAHLSLQSELSMLNFTPKDEEETVSAAAGRHADLPNQMHSLAAPSSSNFIGGIEDPQMISHQMAPAWFGKYGNDKNGLLVASYEGQKITNVPSHPYFHSRTSGSRENSAIVEQRTESCLEGTTGNSTLVPTVSANDSSQCSALPSGSNHGVLIRSKKRKIATSDLLSWQKAVTSSPIIFRSISMAVQEWAQAANVLLEQMDDEGESVFDSPSTSRPQKRLILTTKLMQCLLPTASRRLLRVDAADSYESLTFGVAKSALADACSLIHSADSSVCLDQNNMNPRELKSYARMDESMSLKIMDNFIGRSKKLENDLLRLDKRTSLLDVRLECQEIERFSIVNRLGKFRGRRHSECAETSNSQTAIRKAFPQRYVTVVSVPEILPLGVPCLSL